jgi:hypothetical protein
VPVAAPLIITDTPGKGNPLSFNTCPFTVSGGGAVS